jgi:hypothetical protein
MIFAVSVQMLPNLPVNAAQRRREPATSYARET